VASGSRGYRGPDAEPAPGLAAPREVRASAGEPVAFDVTVTNAAAVPRALSVTVLGVDAAWLPRPTRSRVLAPGESLAAQLWLHPTVGTVPARYPLAIAVQALDPDTGQASAPTQLATVDLVVDAPGQVSVALSPADVTGVFGRRFSVVLQNSGTEASEVELEVRAAENARVRLHTYRASVPAGQSVPVRGRAAPRRVRWLGQRARHAFTVTAQTGGAPRHAEGSFTARALFGPSATKATVLLAVVAVWVALAIVFIPKIANSEKHRQTTAQGGATAQSGGSGGTGGPGGGSGSGGGGSGGSGSSGSGSGSPSRTGAAGAAKTLQLNGTVTGNAPAGVSVSVAPTSLVDEQAVEAKPVGVSPDAFGAPGKIAGEAVDIPQQQGDRSTVTSSDGSWSVPGLHEPGYYLVTFAKPGYQTQRYIVDSTAVIATQPLAVTLVPGQGTMSGRLTGPHGPVGGAQITLTDGTNTVTTTSDSKGAIGAWTVQGLSTPSDYVVSASLDGLGTEAQLVHLDAGGSATVDLTLHTGVASVTGTVGDAGGSGGIGDVTVTATDGSLSRTVTTVTTASLRGSYTLSDLPAPGDYTVSFTAPGFLTQTLHVATKKGQPSVREDVTLFPASATVAGSVFGDQLDAEGNASGTDALVGAGLVLSSPDQTYKTTSGDGGLYRFDGVAPGDYVLSAEYSGLTTMFKSVTVEPGSTAQVTVAQFDLKKLPAAVSSVSIVGFASDGAVPNNTLCEPAPPSPAPTNCYLQFTLVDGDGTQHALAQSTMDTARFGPTEYRIAPETQDLAPGLYQLTISVYDKQTNQLQYLPAKVDVEVPLQGVATAPPVGLFKSDSIVGNVQASGNLVDNGTKDAAGQEQTYTSCVYAIPVGTTLPSGQLSGCDSSTLPVSTCGTTGDPGPGFATIASDNTYAISGLCDGTYNVYYVIQNPWYVNNVATQRAVLAEGLTARLNIQVTAYGKLSLTLAQLPTDGSTTGPVPQGTKVSLNCASALGQAMQLPDVTSTGDLKTVFVFGGFPAGSWECTGTASGEIAATTGFLTLGNEAVVPAQLVFTQVAGTFAGRVTTTWSGSATGIAGGTVTVTGVVGYVNGSPLTRSATVRPDAAGCFVVTPGANLPDGYTAPAGCADDPDIATAVASLGLVSPVATFQYVAPSGYQTPPVEKDQTLVASQLTPIVVQPAAVVLASGTISTDPAPDSGASSPYDGFAVHVTQSAPGAGQLSVTVDPDTGAIGWQDSTLQPDQIAPGHYTLQISKTGYLTRTVAFLCQPVVPCDLGTITVEQLGSLTVTTTSDGSTPVADPTVSLLTATGALVQRLQPGPGRATVTFPGLTPGADLRLSVQAAGYVFGGSSGASPPVSLQCDRGGAAVQIAPGLPTTCTATLTRDGAIAGDLRGVLALPGTASPPTQSLGNVVVTAASCGDATATGTDGLVYCTGTPGPSFTAITDASGRFRVAGTSATQGLDAGYWLVTAAVTGYGLPALPDGAPSNARPGFVVHITSTTADTTSDPQLFVDPVQFSVTVKDQIGHVVTGLGDDAVSLILGGTQVATAHEVAGSGGTSTYVFSDVIPGAYTLEVAATGYLTTDQQVQISIGDLTQSYTAPVVAGANRVPVTVTGLQGTAAISSALGGASVCIVPTSGTGSCATRAVKGTDGAALVGTTAADGTFTFPDVPDGSFLLQGERYGYVTGTSTAFTFKHTQPPPPVTLDLARVTHNVVVTVTASDPLDPIAGFPGGSLTSPSGASPANTTLSVTNAGAPASHDQVAEFSAPEVPYGCWTFTVSAGFGHFGSLSAPTSGSASDGTLSCDTGQFLVSGTPGGDVSVGYSYDEYQPVLTVTADKATSDPAPTLTVSATKHGDSSTSYPAAAVSVGTATPLGFWVAPDTGVDLSVSTDDLTVWPGGTATATSTSPSVTVALVEITEVVVTVKDASGNAVSGAAVTLTSAGRDLSIGPTDSDANGQVSIAIPYATDWIAHAQLSPASGQSAPFATSSATTDVSVTLH
jgi:hypothetical protein